VWDLSCQALVFEKILLLFYFILIIILDKGLTIIYHYKLMIVKQLLVIMPWEGHWNDKIYGLCGQLVKQGGEAKKYCSKYFKTVKAIKISNA